MLPELIRHYPHRRYNQLNGEWILVSPHRAKRPWQGKMEDVPADDLLSYDAGCYLCPGNARAGGQMNPDYKDAFVFENDFAALLKEQHFLFGKAPSLLKFQMASGVCKVISFSERHDLTMAELSKEQLLGVVNAWINECVEIAKDPGIHYIQVFENKGAIMGCSNPHPHGQIWASDFIPEQVLKENKHQQDHYETKGRTLLADYLREEWEAGERIVCRNEHFTVLVPFWALWPYETLLIPHRAMQYLQDMDKDEKDSLAAILQEITVRYDNLFETSFPYSSGIHQAPVNGVRRKWWHWHMHYYPPLLRSASIKKFMVGYEMLAEAQRDITPEQAAEKLRSAATVHYKKASHHPAKAVD